MQNREAKIEELLQVLTIEEKVALCHANSKFTVSGAERLGIPALSMSDGPHGVREELKADSWEPAGRDDDYCSYLPTGTALSATWNKALVKKFGEVLGNEARFREKDIILAPSINIIRHPLCGRNFEYLSEDPCLTEKLCPEIIKGIQSKDTACCVKHFALNNQELDRGFVNVEVSRRALFEIYLRGFYAAVKDGGAYSVMGSYNRYQGQHCCHNDYLFNTVLKQKWGFDGVCISDWSGVHDTNEAVFCGLDIEMGTEKPYNEYYLADNFLKLAKSSPEALTALNDKVRRILRLSFKINKASALRNKGAFNTEEHQRIAYDIAKEAVVLLKNSRNILPVKDGAKILVVGENATARHAAGGGSSGLKPSYEITPLEGIKSLFEKSQIEYVNTTGCEYTAIPMDYLEIIDTGAGCRAYKCEAFENADFTGKKAVKFMGEPEITEGYSSFIYTAIMTCKADKSYKFSFTADESSSLYFNNGLIMCGTGKTEYFSYTSEDGSDLYIQIETVCKPKQPPELLINKTESFLPMAELAEKAKQADYVIYCGGINHNLECEGFDRPDMRLPDIQNTEISELLNVNKNTVIIINAGAPVEMPWIHKAHTVIWNGYLGMEGGNALADILKGSVSPSGKLPFTLPYKLCDHPALRYGEYKAVNCKYNEELLVGYRGFEKDNIEPMFCFGHGLSYSSFAFGNFSVSQAKDSVNISFSLANIGKYDGAETVQVYIGKRQVAPNEPLKQLRGFKKLFLEADKSVNCTISLSLSDFYDYCEECDEFRLLKNDFTIYIGTSSKNIVFKSEISIKE